MKKYIFSVLLGCLVLFLKAEEGMWIPFEMDSTMLQNAGLQLPFNDLFSNHDSSLKDAVVLFGGGCTGEIISNQGLILTNHHCGYYSISSVSDTVNNYLKNGFWANSLEEEIPISGLSVSFVKRYVNITDRVNEGIAQNSLRADSIRAANIEGILKQEKKNNGREFTVKSTFRDTYFYLIELEVYRDIRLVGAPPVNVANFGGDYDNWVFPRHSADFSIFRIYADSLQKPSVYRASNKPLKPVRSFSIDVREVQENDFCMVYGFPGSTNKYLSSYGLNQEVNTINPIRIKLRESYLQTLKKYMDVSEFDMLKYTAQYNRISNHYKKMQGQIIGVNHFQVLAQKQKLESDYLHNLSTQNTYSSLSSTYQLYQPYRVEASFYHEMTAMIPLLKSFKFLDQFFVELERNKINDTLNDYVHKNINPFLRGGQNIDLEKEVFTQLLTIYLSQDTNSIKRELISYIRKSYRGRIDLLTEDIYEESAFAKKWDDIKNQELNFKKDPLTLFYLYFNKGRSDFTEEKERLMEDVEQLEEENLSLVLQYLQKTGQKKSPDANSTLRLSYGKIKSYTGYEGTWVSPFTNTETMLERSKKNQQFEEYRLPESFQKSLSLATTSKYAKNGQLKVCFISSNHTTGGNSGSPVVNQQGHLMGINFDRSWESTMSDYYFEESVCRNIVLSSNYLLFIIDEYAHCQHIMKELNVINN